MYIYQFMKRQLTEETIFEIMEDICSKLNTVSLVW